MNDEEYELIECSECGEEKKVEKGTWALDKGICEPCYCIYQGG
jgi:formylmethanofuran dehydrogenase subunit E